LRQSTLLIINTSVTYMRMGLTILLGLVATRLLVHLLGFADFGVLSALGATGVLLSVVADAFSGSAQRHMAYEIGQKNHARLLTVFNTSLALFVGLAAGVIVLGSVLSPLIVRGLTVPIGRQTAAWWTLELTLASLALTIAQVPFAAFADARQALALNALRDLLGSLLAIAAVGLLYIVPGDRMVLYAGFFMVTRGIVLAVAATAAMRFFPECRPNLRCFDRAELGRIAHYAGWASLGSLAWQLRMYGSMILLNIRFGPVVNSAYAIAIQVAGYQNSFGGAIYVAARSAIISHFGQGDLERVRALVLMTSKYACLTMLIFVVPIQFETHLVLRLWLKEFPPLAPTFVRLAMAWVAMLALCGGFHIAMLAQQRIGPYVRMNCAFDIAVMLLGIVEFYVFGWNPTALLVTAVLVTGNQIIAQAIVAGHKIGLALRVWNRRVLAPVLLTYVCCLVAVIPMWRWANPGMARLLAIAGTCTVITTVIGWFTAASAERGMALAVLGRLTGWQIRSVQ
jgi:O-antigen/teichoic acid export membrane protein